MSFKSKIVKYCVVLVIILIITFFIKNIYSRFNGDMIDLGTVSLDYHGKNTTLGELMLDGEEYLIIYLSSLGCSSCAEKELAMLNSIPDTTHIVIIGRFNSNREYKIFSERTTHRVLRIRSTQCLKVFEEPRHNYMFMLRQNGKLNKLIDITKNPNSTSDYYKLFFNKKG